MWVGLRKGTIFRGEALFGGLVGDLSVVMAGILGCGRFPGGVLGWFFLGEVLRGWRGGSLDGRF